MSREDVDRLIAKRRISWVDDYLFQGMRVNRLFGLKKLIDEHINDNTVMCEIGSYCGVSSELFSRFCRTIHCVDVFCEPPYEQAFDMMNSMNPNIVKIKNNSVDASSLFDDEFFDFVYIDAGHTYQDVKNDIRAWRPKIKSGGTIGGHDYYTNGDSMVLEAVNEFFPLDQITVYEDSSWVVKL